MIHEFAGPTAQGVLDPRYLAFASATSLLRLVDTKLGGGVPYMYFRLFPVNDGFPSWNFAVFFWQFNIAQDF